MAAGIRTPASNLYHLFPSSENTSRPDARKLVRKIREGRPRHEILQEFGFSDLVEMKIAFGKALMVSPDKFCR